MSSDDYKDTTPSKRRVLIADSHPLYRRGLAELINGEPDLTVCAAVDADSASVEAIASSRPDIVITDCRLHRVGSVNLVSDIHARFQDLPIIVQGMNDDPHRARRAIEAGARGFVGKQERGETLLTAIHEVLDGATFVGVKKNVDHDGN
jgi:DNA-binding NarL/FixJ family response regulator